MNVKDMERILKKYNIPEFKSLDEKLELLDIVHEKLEEQYSKTNSTDTYAELTDVKAVILALKQQDMMLVQLDVPEEKETASVDTDGLKGASNKKGTTSIPITRSTQTVTGSVAITGASGVSGVQSTSATSAASAAPADIWFVSLNGDSTVDGVFSQAQGSLKFSQWSGALRMFESILATEARNPGVFLGRFLCNNQIRSVEEIVNNTTANLEQDTDLRKAKDFGNPQQVKALEDLLDQRKNKIQYNQAVDLASKDNDIASLEQAATILDGLNGYKDSQVLAQNCRSKVEQLKKQQKYAKDENDAREKMKQLLTKFKDYSLPGYDFTKSKKELQDMEQKINDLRRGFPITKQLATDQVMREVVEAKKKEIEEIESYLCNKKRRARRRCFACLLVMLLLLIVGAHGFLFTCFWRDDYKASGLATYFPAHMGCETVEYSDSDASVFISFSPILSSVNFNNCPNMKTIITPFSENCIIRGLDLKEYETGAALVTDMDELEVLTILPTQSYMPSVTIKNCKSLKTINAVDGYHLTIEACPSLEKINANYLRGLEVIIENQEQLDKLVSFSVEGTLTIISPEITTLDLSKLDAKGIALATPNVKEITLSEKFMGEYQISDEFTVLEKVIIPTNTKSLIFSELYRGCNIQYVDDAGTSRTLKAYEGTFDAIEYELSSGNFAISTEINQYTGEEVRSITVNAELEGFQAQNIADLNKIILKNGIKTATVSNCANLSAIEFTEGTESIVITDCPYLKNWVLPESVTYCSINGEVLIGE